MQKNRIRTRAQTGFALIEALIALAVTLVGLSGALRLQAELVVASADAKASDEAVALAQVKLTELSDIQNETSYLALSSGNSRQAGQLHDYLVVWSLTQGSNPPQKQIAIEVRWPAANPTRRIGLQTLIPNLELSRLAAQQLQL